MKRGLQILVLALVSVFSICAQDSAANSPEGFGLQASIFRNARSVSTDLNRNFADASDYILTPGDVFTLTLSAGIGLNATSGNRVASYSIQLQEDYTLNIPVLGRVDARGKRIPELQRYISDALVKALTLQHVSFNLSAPAQFNVFIYGNVAQPGFVVATPMYRLIDAIGIAGGFKANGSYRNIELLRDGRTSAIDISRFFNQADFEANPYLRPGDRIFVPQADIVTSITGLVRFPGTYELVDGETVGTLIELAGGLLPGSDRASLEIQRVDASGTAQRLVVAAEDSSKLEAVMGDHVTVRSISENVERITLEGAVYGGRLAGDAPVEVPDRSFRLDFPYFPGITLLDILDGAGGPTPRAMLDDSFIRRASTDEVLPLNIAKLWETRDELENIPVFPGDYIYVPLQRTEVFVSGAVIRPGAVSYTPGYSVSDYILLVGGLDENRADPKDIALLDESGNATPVELTDVVPPGSHIHVDKRWLFAADQSVQNVLITTAWVTSFVTVISAVLDLVFTYFLQ